MPKENAVSHLFAGGVAGVCEALSCHPLDTIKVRMQLRSKHSTLNQSFISVGTRIVSKEGFPGLYKGLGAVVSGIAPKMAIRFSSFEAYKQHLESHMGENAFSTFIAGTGAGITEAVLVVTPMEVLKIRMQAQRHSLMDPNDIPKYRSVPHAFYTIVNEEGIRALYKGVILTAARQVYAEMKEWAQRYQNSNQLPSWQHLVIGGISGAMGNILNLIKGPLSNAPLDTIKTRIQKQASEQGGWTRFITISKDIIQNEGWLAFYKGLTPRLLRVAPGQAITFMVYEKVSKWLNGVKIEWNYQETNYDQ